MKKSHEVIAIEDLLLLARACAKARGCQITTISRLSHGDPPAITNLIDGTGSITLRKHTHTMEWLQDPINWPDGWKIPALEELRPNQPAKPKRKKSDGRSLDTGQG